MAGDDGDSSFTLFADLSPDEQAHNQQRRQHMHSQASVQLQSLSEDPCQRSTGENRRVFNHVRRDRFQAPQTMKQLFTLDECNAILDVCRSAGWTTARHSAFPTTDIPVRGTRLEYLAGWIRRRLFPVLGRHFGFDACRDLDFRDIFIVKYTASAQRGLEAHEDGCLMSFNVLLSHPDDFDGGGTWFDSTGSGVHPRQGDCVYHDARVMHRGIDITRGERYILVGFLDTVDTVAKDGLAGTARRGVRSM